MQPVDLRGRLAVVASFLSMFLMGIAVALLGPSLPGIARQWQIPVAQAGLLFTLLGVGSLLAPLAIAGLADRPVRHVILVIAALLFAAMLWAFAASRSLIQGGAAIGLAGFALTAGGTIPNVLIAQLYGKRAPSALNSLHMVSAIGSFCAPLAVGLAIGRGSNYAAVFRGLALLEVAAAVLWLVARPPRTEEVQGRPQFAPALLRPLFPLALLMLFYVGSEQTIGGWAFTYTEAIGRGPEAASAATSLFWLAFIGGRLFAIRLLARFDCIPVIVSAALLGGLGVGLTLLGSVWPTALWLGLALTGLAFGPVFPTTLAVGGQLLPGRSGMTSSLLVAAGSFGAMLLPATAGAMIPIFSATGAIALVEILLAIMLICLWVLSSRRSPATG